MNTKNSRKTSENSAKLEGKSKKLRHWNT